MKKNTKSILPLFDKIDLKSEVERNPLEQFIYENETADPEWRKSLQDALQVALERRFELKASQAKREVKEILKLLGEDNE